MISRFLSIAALSLLFVGGPSVACAASWNDGPAKQAIIAFVSGEYVAHNCILQSMGECVRQVQGMLVKRGYLRDYHEGDWDECTERAAAAFFSDKGKLEAMPEIPEIADELEKTPADVRRNGEPVC